ncbi:alpha/beta-hydrolase [Trichodelitschia bisporula]|uniref:Carboxylic ester hydrolase n=1 Tax=Trichodelitschia bisporula TaxID=703511 RepID=A0A6G1IAA6_9PEZI|nr:alpha/beta-hydrolase [Trichodelitschia bisporula]
MRPLLFAAIAAAAPALTPVRTSSGPILGHASNWHPAVTEYLGIPYAQPPVGTLRFAPPAPYTSNASFTAAHFSPTCPGNVHANGSISYVSVKETVKSVLGEAESVFGEDCLSLNIWTRPEAGERSKAVMFWIYGGGFNAGNSDSPVYNGARLAEEQDVVVVSINYRVHAFGFPGAPFLADKNVGLLDQRLALEWVRDNIAAFGGDPTRITIFGQSAGGLSVDYHTYAWASDPIAAGFISSSGSITPTTRGGVSGSGTGWWTLSKALGCGNATAGEASLACVRGKSMEQILSATRELPRVGVFGPTPDGRVVFEDTAARRARGQFAHRPLLVGNTNNEGALYEMLGQVNLFSGSGPGINCLTKGTAGARAKAGVPTWRYIYQAEWPNADIGKKGAYHAADIPLWFGTTERFTHVADTAEEKVLIQKMMGAWAGFAKDPVGGLGRLGWPRYDESTASVVLLGGPNSAEIKFEKSATVDVYGTAGQEKAC